MKDDNDVAEDLDQVIRESAEGPAEAHGDAGGTKQQSLRAINVQMDDGKTEGRFVTFILCIVDTRNHEVVLANAGHAAPIIRRAGGSVEQSDQERA